MAKIVSKSAPFLRICRNCGERVSDGATACKKCKATDFYETETDYLQAHYEIIGDTLVRCAHEEKKMWLPSFLRTVGSHAFAECKKIEEIEFPFGLKEIGENAFGNCNALQKISLPTDIERIGTGAFAYCHALKTVEYRGSLDGFLEIEQTDLFRGLARPTLYIDGAPLEELIVPAWVTELKEKQFWGAKFLKKVVLPPTVKRIGAHAFEFCEQLEEVVFSEGLEHIESYAFLGTGVKEIVLPESLKMMDACVFQSCKNLTRATVKKNLRQIGVSAFEKCTSLREVVIAEGLHTIQTSAFRGCTNLEKIIIPKSVRAVAMWAFKDCSKSKLRIYARAFWKPRFWRGGSCSWNPNRCPVKWNYKKERDKNG